MHQSNRNQVKTKTYKDSGISFLAEVAVNISKTCIVSNIDVQKSHFCSGKNFVNEAEKKQRI